MQKRYDSICIASYSRMYGQNFRSMVINFRIRHIAYLNLPTAKTTLGADINSNAYYYRTSENIQKVFISYLLQRCFFILGCILLLVYKY